MLSHGVLYPKGSRWQHLCACLQEAQALLQAAADGLGLRLKPLDKKAERALVQAQQEDLRAQLAEQADPAAALSLVVPLLVMQVSSGPSQHSLSFVICVPRAFFVSWLF